MTVPGTPASSRVARLLFRCAGPLLPVGGITAIYLLSAIPATGIPSAFAIPHLDKGIHALAYALLLSSFRLWRGPGRSAAGWLPGAIGGSLVAALGDEWHQAAVPGRSPDPLDLLADLGGIALGALFWGRSSRFLPPS
jgi:hypothetical protein